MTTPDSLRVMRFDRTVKNWRWWVVLPLVPLAIVVEVMQFIGAAGDAIEPLFVRAFRWQRKGWKA